jgi:sRNA-binding protein
MRVSDAAESNSFPNGGAPRGAVADARGKTPGHANVRALLDELLAVFPACFKPHLTPGLPLLKTGIGDDILARRPDIDPALLERALSVYASGPEYWRGVIAGRPRVDLDGAVVQAAATAEEIAAAETRLAAFEIKQRARKQSYAEVRALLDDLAAAFPACFKPHRTLNQPLLKIGIDADILGRKPEIDPALLSAALRVYVSSPAYQRSVIAGRPRVDLDGAVVQATITANEIAHARTQLQAIQRRAEKRRNAQSAKSPVGQADG